jgi:DNA-binding response OmpR family regulator
MIKNIAILEDDKTMGHLLKTLLEIEGYQVHVFEEFATSQIISNLNGLLPVISLIDLHLHDIDGLEIIKEIRLDQKLQDIFIIATSGSEMKDLAISAGADHFLLKPYMPDELLSQIKILAG